MFGSYPDHSNKPKVSQFLSHDQAVYGLCENVI